MTHIPDDLRYAPGHEWARSESDGTVVVGVSDHGQDLLGDMVFFCLPEVGKVVAAGDPVAGGESVKSGADAHAPVAGTVIEVNAAAADAPESVNSDPYGTWLFKLRPTDPAEIATLMDAATYRASL
jgi:glycine cleavage system H protein